MQDGDWYFVKPVPEELRCPIHLGVLRDPVVASCGHSFCRTCIHVQDDGSLRFLTADEKRELAENAQACSQPFPHCTPSATGSKNSKRHRIRSMTTGKARKKLRRHRSVMVSSGRLADKANLPVSDAAAGVEEMREALGSFSLKDVIPPNATEVDLSESGVANAVDLRDSQADKQPAEGRKTVTAKPGFGAHRLRTQDSMALFASSDDDDDDVSDDFDSDESVSSEEPEGHMRCPIDEQHIGGDVYPNLLAVSVISQLRVQCRFRLQVDPNNTRDGELVDACKAVFPLGHIASHEMNCSFAKQFSDPVTPRRRGLTSARVPMNLSWEIDFNEVRLLYRVGMGAFGEVFKGTFRGTTVAVKRIIRKFNTTEQLSLFEDEVNFMKSIRHPNTVLFVGACRQQPNLCLVTEFMDGGSLRDLIDAETQNYDWKRMLLWLQHAASGMCYLHGENIVHRDIKSDNLLVSGGILKVADFGLARMVDSGQMSQAGNWACMAPEILRCERFYDEKVDVYSFGIVICEVITKKKAEDIPRTASMVLDRKQFLAQMVPKGTPSGLAHLAADCCAAVAADRPSFTDILKRLEESQVVMTARVQTDPIPRRSIHRECAPSPLQHQ